MESSNLVATNTPSLSAIAPAWHTVVVLLAVFGLSFAGARSNSMPFVATHKRVGGYILVMVVEWAIVAFIAYGLRSRGVRVRDLVAGRWTRALDFLRDLGLAIAFLIISGVILNGLQHLLKAHPNAAIRNLFPHGPAEIAVYLLMCATAGFCEELIFRGYLQRQFAAMSGMVGGIVLQGIAFGLGHGYQGWKYMLMIAVFGILFGLMAQWRKSLRPGMIAHFVQDGAGGLLGPRFMR